ncbi:MAG TPA: STAS domain-containing protein [Terriglobales bacterium]|nr:STAS domain-containing protein [Terriglobales bacterium]
MSSRPDKTGIDIAVSDGGVLASLYGRIDIDSSPAVRDRLLAVFQAPHPKSITIDLSAVSHMDSSGVATLIEALKVARSHRTEMRLQGLHDRLFELFELTGILALFNGSSNMHQSGRGV